MSIAGDAIIKKMQRVVKGLVVDGMKLSKMLGAHHIGKNTRIKVPVGICWS